MIVRILKLLSAGSGLVFLAVCLNAFFEFQTSEFANSGLAGIFVVYGLAVYVIASFLLWLLVSCAYLILEKRREKEDGAVLLQSDKKFSLVDTAFAVLTTVVISVGLFVGYILVHIFFPNI